MHKGRGKPWGPFFRMSFSRFSRTFSARSRDSAICSGVTTLAPAPWSVPAAVALTQFRHPVFDQPQLLGRRASGQSVFDSLHRQFLELRCVLLLRYLHRLPYHGDCDYTSSVEDEISGEAQTVDLNGSSLITRSTSTCCRKHSEKKPTARPPPQACPMVSSDVSGAVCTGLPVGTIQSSRLISAQSGAGSIGLAPADSYLFRARPRCKRVREVYRLEGLQL